MAKRKVSPFKKGRAGRRSSGGSQFISVKADSSLTIAPLVGLDQMVSADMHEYWDIKPAIYHPCIGRNCPGCIVENEPRFKAYLPVLVRGEDLDPKIFPFTISVYNQLESLEDALDGETLAGKAIKISRNGSGMATRYTVVGTGKTIEIDGVEVPDFIDQLGPQTESTIWDLLEANGFERLDKEKPAEKPKESTDTVSDDDVWVDT